MGDRPSPAGDRPRGRRGELVEPVLDSGCGTGEHTLLAASMGFEAPVWTSPRPPSSEPVPRRASAGSRPSSSWVTCSPWPRSSGWSRRSGPSSTRAASTPSTTSTGGGMSQPRLRPRTGRGRPLAVLLGIHTGPGGAAAGDPGRDPEAFARRLAGRPDRRRAVCRLQQLGRGAAQRVAGADRSALRGVRRAGRKLIPCRFSAPRVVAVARASVSWRSR